MNIQSLYQSGRFPHAVLILGNESAVEQVLKLYKCEAADTVYVKKSMADGSYKIKPLREIIASGSLRPQFGDTRVFVFSDFGSMSEICQNALLKFIEEPQEYNRFVMTAETSAKILPTILSRVVVIRSEGGETAGEFPAEVEQIAKAVLSALKAKSEYDTAMAFCKVRDRQVLNGVLQTLLRDLSELMVSARSPQKVINATDVLQKYIQRIETNPNVAITAAACAAGLYTALHS